MCFKGDRAAELRGDLGLKSYELAEKLDITYQTVSDWENNHSTPGLETAYKLAQMYDVSLDYLCGLTDDPISYRRENYIALSSKCPDHIREQLKELVTSLNKHFNDK